MKSPLSYAEQQEKKRKALSVGITFGLYGLTLAVGIALSILNPQEQNFSNTTVVINLDGPVMNQIGLGSTNPSEKGDEATVAEPSVPVKTPEAKKTVDEPKAMIPDQPAAKPLAKPAPSPTPPNPVAKVEPASVVPAPGQPKVAETPGASSEPLPEVTPPGAVASTPEETPLTPWVPGQRDPGSHISSTNSMLFVPGKGEVPWTGSQMTIRKSEKGSASETTLGGAQGTVGQNLYVPIYYSFPLPKIVPASIYNAIPDLTQSPNVIIYSAQARKKAFASYYEFDGSAYRLKMDVPLDQREPLWQILEDAGYNVADADYKKGRNLLPVVIVFTVTNNNQIKGAEIYQSTGDADMDRAALNGFKRGMYWNKTGETVPGRFTYRF